MSDYQPLGRTPLMVPRLGVGAMTWGAPAGMARFSPAKLAYGGPKSAADEAAAFTTAVAAGVTLFDTAAMYSGGASERLGELAEDSPALIATKFPPRIRTTDGDMPAALQASLTRLRRRPVNLYQHHFPSRRVDIARLMGRMADAAESGQVRAVGVGEQLLGRTTAAGRRRARQPRHRAGLQPGCSTPCCTVSPRPTGCSRPAASWT